jgi:hypothetical protein
MFEGSDTTESSATEAAKEALEKEEEPLEVPA